MIGVNIFSLNMFDAQLEASLELVSDSSCALQILIVRFGDAEVQGLVKEKYFWVSISTGTS